MTLARAYEEIMERVAVSEQMRRRVLAQIARADLGPAGAGRYRRTLRQYGAAAACAALLLAGAAVLPRYLDLRQTEPPGHTETVSRFTEVDSLTELEAAVGLELEELETLPLPVTDTVYTAFGQEMAEIRYCGETETAVLRKAAGEDDPSGDYTQYAEERTLAIGGTSVLLRGDGGRYVLALWQKDGHACSLRLTGGLAAAAWEQLLRPLC